jgi:hypothetical protein
MAEGRGPPAMTAPLAVIAVMALALGTAALAVFGLGDDATFVPPPEAEAESFVRAMATHRYEQALAHVTDELRAGGPGALRRRQEDLERSRGHVRDVRGGPAWRSGGSAEAAVALATSSGPAVLRLRLVRRHGEWRVASLGEWGPGRRGRSGP